jgi:hypothetical protein
MFLPDPPGQFHEAGHNHQIGEWTWDGTGEVTVNFFSAIQMQWANNITTPLNFYGAHVRWPIHHPFARLPVRLPLLCVVNIRGEPILQAGLAMTTPVASMIVWHT